MRRTEPLAQQQCLIRCRHCRIFFLTHRRNHRRLHLVSCPFGCRKEHEQRESARRAAAYYQEHPDKKRALNERRYRLMRPPVAKGATADTPPGPGPQTGDPSPSPQCPPALLEVLPKAQDPEVIGHVRIMISLIEGRQISLEEIWETLLHFWRQRTIGRRRKIDHTVAWLNAHPP